MRALILAAILMVTSARRAHTDDAAATPKPRFVRYAHKLLPFDLIAAGLAGAAGYAYDRTSENVPKALTALAVGTYLLGPLVVHERERGISSPIIVRTVFPLVGTALGFWYGPRRTNQFASARGAVAGAAIGAGVAILIDYAVIARKRVAVTPAVVTHGAGVALVGAF